MNTNLTIRVDKSVKEKSQAILNNLGLDLSSVINMLLRQIILKESVPFSIDSRTVNDETRLVLAEAEKGENLSKRFGSVDELIEDLNK